MRQRLSHAQVLRNLLLNIISPPEIWMLQILLRQQICGGEVFCRFGGTGEKLSSESYHRQVSAEVNCKNSANSANNLIAANIRIRKYIHLYMYGYT
jgi:hypothetical protein